MSLTSNEQVYLRKLKAFIQFLIIKITNEVEDPNIPEGTSERTQDIIMLSIMRYQSIALVHPEMDTEEDTPRQNRTGRVQDFFPL